MRKRRGVKLEIYKILFLVQVFCLLGSIAPIFGLEFQAQPCVWDSAVGLGELDPDIINEASGLAISKQFNNRLYHVNDSGDSARFYITDFSGGNTRTVNIEFFAARDVEDLAVAECGSIEGTCLYIADIGDNLRVRDDLEIVLVQEQEQFNDRVLPVDTVRVRYPDGAKDAESLAIHPSGDLFILSKGANYPLFTVFPSKIYRLTLERRLGADGQIQELELVGEVDFTTISSDTFSGSLPTAFDFSRDGSRFLVLTYVNAFEFYINLSDQRLPATADLVAVAHFREIPLEMLLQQESIAYLGESAFIYTTEALDGTARIMRVRCRQ